MRLPYEGQWEGYQLVLDQMLKNLLVYDVLEGHCGGRLEYTWVMGEWGGTNTKGDGVGEDGGEVII